MSDDFFFCSFVAITQNKFIYNVSYARSHFVYETTTIVSAPFDARVFFFSCFLPPRFIFFVFYNNFRRNKMRMTNRNGNLWSKSHTHRTINCYHSYRTHISIWFRWMEQVFLECVFVVVFVIPTSSSFASPRIDELFEMANRESRSWVSALYGLHFK